MSTITLDIRMDTTECGECGGVYALTAEYVRKKREKGGYWTCPYCKCGWGYDPKGSELARAKREAEEARRRAASAEGREKRAREQADREARRASAYKGQITKVKKRVANGVCPCCNRTFENLARHMETKHPEWAPDSLRVVRRGGPWYDIKDAKGEVVASNLRGLAHAHARLAELNASLTEATP